MKNAKRFYVLLFAGMVCIVMFGLFSVYVYYISGRAVPTFPRVTINTTIPEVAGVVNQPVMVFGEASDPDGIKSAELWVNGAKVASQTNPDQDLYPFEISQSWIPDGTGNYIFLLRGIDWKGFASESTPVMIQIGERTFQPDPALLGQYIVKEGDTIESIAEHFGTTPEVIREINPGMEVDPLPSESLSVPPGPETDSGGDAPPSGDGSDEPPHVSPPSAPSLEVGVPAVPAHSPLWESLPLPGGFNCILTPALCATPLPRVPLGGGDPPPLPASDVHASLVDACQVSVSWTDNATNETGFHVYRWVVRPRVRIELIALLEPSHNSGGRLNYVDTSAQSGQQYYVVTTINSRGEQVWSSGPSEIITTTCASSTDTAGGRALDVEALQMTINDPSIERIYCYLSLAGSPFERIPESAGEYITLEGGAWNIADYASGDNKRTIMLDGISPMEIIAECLGWQGGTLIDLGRFTRSHPPEEWDGRSLSAGPDTSAFNVTYRIQPTTSDGTSAVYGTEGTFDPTVPLPFNVRAINGWTDCRYFRGCSIVNEPGLAWDYAVDPANPRPPIYFNVYKHVLTDGTMRESRIQTTLDGTHMSAPQASDCGEHVYYSVEAVVGFGSFYAEEIISGRSEALEIMPTCATLEITLVSMYVYGVDDGAPCTIFADCAEDYEAYGVFWFGGSPLTWNNHCDNELCGGGSSSTYTIIDEATNYNWANMSLRKASGGFSRGNNVIRIPFRDQEKILWNFQLKDHDSSSADDSWCGFGINHNLLPKDYTLTELLTLDKDKVIRDRNFEIGSYGCDITLHLRGIPGTP